MFDYALALLKNSKVETLPLALLRDAGILAIAPYNQLIGPGNSALHFLAFAGRKKDVDRVLLQDLADTLCRVCGSLLNHRNARDMTALHIAASQGNDIVVKALLEAGAGFIFTFILTLN